MLRLAFDFIITWRETRTRPNAYVLTASLSPNSMYKTKKLSKGKISTLSNRLNIKYLETARHS